MNKLYSPEYEKDSRYTYITTKFIYNDYYGRILDIYDFESGDKIETQIEYNDFDVCVDYQGNNLNINKLNKKQKELIEGLKNTFGNKLIKD